MKVTIQAILLVIFLISCSVDNRSNKKVSELSIENNEEFKKVLKHYSAPKDSLKFRAALFLIKNLPYHSSVSSPYADAYGRVCDSLSALDQSTLLTKDSLTNRAIRKDNFEHIWQHYLGDIKIKPADEFTVKQDLKEVKADYLITNIEYAFKAWENPWSKSYTFDEFCKFILPYRVGNEPLDEWRPYLFEQLKWVKDSLKNTDDPVKVSGFMNKWLQNTIYDDRIGNIYPGGINVTNLFKGRIWSSCHDQTALGIAVLRALGIAAAASTIPQWGVRHGGHEFNAVLDTAGKWRYFSTGYLNPDEFYLDNRAPKVYLSKFFAEPTSNDLNSYQNLTNRDITNDFLKVSGIRLKIAKQFVKSDIYLCVFDNASWRPVCKGVKIADDQFRFAEMGREMVYLPGILRNGKVFPVMQPFMLDIKGKVTHLLAQKKKIAYSFERKFPNLFPRVYEPRCKDLMGGKFQIANDSSFKDATDIFVIREQPGLDVKTVKIQARSGRYIRYIFPPADYAFKSGPALISFFDSGNKKISGSYIGSMGVTEENMRQIFDDDLLTHTKVVPYDRAINFRKPDIIINKASKDSLWVGMKLTGQVHLSTIQYCARNDKNGIYQGMRYQLFYWRNGNWRSLGIRRAGGSAIRFDNIPAGALLWLRNLDEGSDERIFVINQNKVTWM